MKTSQPFLPGLSKFTPVLPRKLKPIYFFDFMAALEKKGWAYHDSGVTDDRNYTAYKVDRHKRHACSWDELKAYLQEKFGNQGRIAFGITRPLYAPEQRTCTVLIAQPKMIKTLNEKLTCPK
jgi:hypothetical protein